MCGVVRREAAPSSSLSGGSRSVLRGSVSGGGATGMFLGMLFHGIGVLGGCSMGLLRF